MEGLVNELKDLAAIVKKQGHTLHVETAECSYPNTCSTETPVTAPLQ